ncbi:adenosylmethionine decarboxylase [Candidatus Parcubacteria bacterium]|nr:adenosylmethionine decarboxylase [Candidatus Parcubacteria bacterium]
MKKTKGSSQWTKTKRNIQKGVGRHLICDFWGAKTIENPRELEEILRLAARYAKSTDLEFIFHKFEPQGLTGVLLLAESHIAFHSWPEIGYLALDIFTCGNKKMPKKALEFLKKKFKPKKVLVKEIIRG